MMLFTRGKYIGLIGLLAVLVIGFILMAGPKPSPSGEFNNDIFCFQRITLAPVLLVGAWFGFIWLILRKPSE